MRQVSQQLPPAASLAALIAALTPIIEEHGYTLNQIIADTATFAVSNPTTLRSFDVSAGTLSDVRQVLGTLLADLKTKGVLA